MNITVVYGIVFASTEARRTEQKALARYKRLPPNCFEEDPKYNLARYK